jgi:uncharacterized protein YggE
MTSIMARPGRFVVAGVVVLAAAAAGLGIGYRWGGSNQGTRYTAAPAAALAAGSGSTGLVGGLTAAGITVTGTGTVSGTPDALHLAMGVAVTRPTVTAALDDANAAAATVQASLRKSGVAEKDLQTSGLSIQPQYTESGGKSTVTGYQVTESVTATLRDLKSAGMTIGQAATAGGDATRIDSVTLDLTDTGSLITAARKSAFAQAKQKAEQYAQAAGAGVGEVISIQETSTTPTPELAVPMATAAAGALASVPIAAGSQQVAVTVTVTFAIS